jgi:superfamily II DNA or RNA helicase
VMQEVKLPDPSTPSGEGRADYVLFGTDGKPLAVIEAKKASVDAESGWTKGRLYADGLEKIHGVRPFIFTTNGYDIWFWNDAAGEPQRKVYGFHSRDSLTYRRFQLSEKKPMSEVAPAPGIIDKRLYQQEAVKKAVERFAQNKRKGLIVQATGTGKTRVAVALCSALSRARWARRILFLCDRRALLTQADHAFKDFLDDLPRTTVSAGTSHDKDKRIYLATYPAMMKCYQTFDVGFFDLIIADETHRSIFNRYRDIFDYFDACQLGLTATPVSFVNRHTFRMFDCEVDDPTFSYTYDEAINNDPPYLVPYEVETYTTEFLRKGIKYADMTREQREEVEETEDDPGAIDHDREEVDRRIFNRDTNRLILKNLLENGIKDATGSRVGKTIIFARNYEHAKQLKDVFDKEYPQYGGAFCQLITSHDPGAEHLLENVFKKKDSDLVIAVSVDMLDTGCGCARGREPRVRQAGVLDRQVLADDRPRHPALREPIRPGQAQGKVPRLRPLEQLRVVWPRSQEGRARASEVAPPEGFRGPRRAGRCRPDPRPGGLQTGHWAHPRGPRLPPGAEHRRPRQDQGDPGGRQAWGTRCLRGGHSRATPEGDCAPHAVGGHRPPRGRVPIRPPDRPDADGSAEGLGPGSRLQDGSRGGVGPPAPEPDPGGRKDARRSTRRSRQASGPTPSVGKLESLRI